MPPVYSVPCNQIHRSKQPYQRKLRDGGHAVEPIPVAALVTPRDPWKALNQDGKVRKVACPGTHTPFAVGEEIPGSSFSGDDPYPFPERHRFSACAGIFCSLRGERAAHKSDPSACNPFHGHSPRRSFWASTPRLRAPTGSPRSTHRRLAPRREYAGDRPPACHQRSIKRHDPDRRRARTRQGTRTQ
jgi:hypothetical protein